MVNLVSPISASGFQRRHVNYWDDETVIRLSQYMRQRLLERRDRLHGLRWVWACNGEVPRSAVKVGDVYIGRAHHEGSVTPGTVNRKKKACLIPWGGKEHKKPIYEVLCSGGKFIKVAEYSTELLVKASSAGISEYGEPLFIGRVEYADDSICGKVQRSHGVCYYGFEGKEEASRKYKVFVADPRTLSDHHYWVSSNTTELIPKNAVIGGIDEKGTIYIGRTRHRRSWTPGGINHATRVCSIAWGSLEHTMAKFDYLCNCKARFIRSSGSRVPVGAVQGGLSESGEPLFIGRVKVNEYMLVGKVQPSHSVCYIGYDGKEMAYRTYEILVLDQ